MTYCTFWEDCARGAGCQAALTEETKAKLRKKGNWLEYWNNKPACYVEAPAKEVVKMAKMVNIIEING